MEKKLMNISVKSWFYYCFDCIVEISIMSEIAHPLILVFGVCVGVWCVWGDVVWGGGVCVQCLKTNMRCTNIEYSTQ